MRSAGGGRILDVTTTRDAGFPMTLRPERATRVANVAGALVIGACGLLGVWGGFIVGLTAHGGWLLAMLGAPPVIYGSILAVRSPGLRIVLTSDHITVRGLFATTRIPRAQVQKVTNYPFIIWTDGRGRRRRTAVNALNVYRSGQAAPNSRVLAVTTSRIDLVREWAGIAASSSAPEHPKVEP